MIYTTNAIESLNSVIRHAIKKRKVFPTDEAVKKVVWLAIQAASQKWTMPLRESLYINLCNCLILICSIQHQKQVTL
ncbi:hypothetical protein KB20921_02530 [Edwardsiella ictaluri]|nr:hypothetical protein KH20906_26940 [Edwardsiella ictaluri]BEI00992.1 hypothetical protein KB20921_02530 [Edwardsiella ictaluri]BEI04466.1 hypothetical protein KH201010_02520 [Edwardsiella ictaluri]BEI10377.1 hypothetical protein STU22726_27080 [Edwardsiella ictaluri]